MQQARPTGVGNGPSPGRRAGGGQSKLGSLQKSTFRRSTENPGRRKGHRLIKDGGFPVSLMNLTHYSISDI